MVKARNLPDINRISVLAAAILLAYGLGRFIEFPGQILEFQVLGIYLPINLSTYTIVSFLVAGLTAAGGDWLMSSHPRITKQTPIEHWILPALTAWVIGIPLYQLPLGVLWWGGFFLGGFLLTLILIAEYIAIDPDDIRQPIAAAGLIALSFALFLMLAMALRFSESRLIILLPALTIASWLVSLRTLHLRFGGRWAPVQAGIIALVCGQIASALHYIPIPPVTFGLVLLAPTYAITSLMANLAENDSLPQTILEPGLLFLLLLAVALIIR